MDELIKLAIQAGPYGVATAAMLYMGYLYHKTILNAERTRNDEHKADKADYKSVITGNTEALTKMSGALENNTQTIRELQGYIRKDK